MKNRTVMVRMLNSDQVASVTEHAKNLGTLAFEVHETESGEYHSIKDAGKYYRNGYTNHVFPSPTYPSSPHWSSTSTCPFSENSASIAYDYRSPTSPPTRPTHPKPDNSGQPQQPTFTSPNFHHRPTQQFTSPRPAELPRSEHPY